MPSFTIRNEAYRDVLPTVPYPFDTFFAEEVDDVFIGNDIFLDAMFYFNTEVQLPVQIGSIDGIYGTDSVVKCNLEDDTGSTIGYFLLEDGHDLLEVKDNFDARCGLINVDPSTAENLIAQVRGRFIPIPTGDMAFCIDCCRVKRSTGVPYIAAGGAVASGAVKLVARHGCQFRKTNTGLALDVLGDPISLDGSGVPIKSVNGVVSQHIWLNGTPECNLRISSNQVLSFNQAKDVTE